MHRSHLLTLSIILFLLTKAVGQYPPTVTQEAKGSPCSNIVALAGDVKIDCASLTPAQQKLIESIPTMLHKILANQLDPKVVMEKLDEIQNDIRHIQINQGWIEPTKEQLAILQGKLTGFPKQKVRIVVTNQDNNKWLIATRLQDVITNGSVGWDVETGANSTLAKPIRGIYIGAKSDTFAARALILGIRDLFGQNVVYFTGFSDDKSDANEWIGIYDSPLP